MKSMIFLMMFLVLILTCFGGRVDISDAEYAAVSKLRQIDYEEQLTIGKIEKISLDDYTLAYCFHLEPIGYIIVSADDDICPIIAYSTTSVPDVDGNDENILFTMVKYDIKSRLDNIDMMDQSKLAENRAQWSRILSRAGVFLEPMERWPETGTTSSGGWTVSNWSQSYPENMYCPIDPVTDSPSYAGCPSIAMAQILNYHRTVNDVFFDDSDDYYHNFGSGRMYWIDNDAADYGFLTYPVLNVKLDTLQEHYTGGIDLTDSDIGALVFACGAAAEQVYSSSGSGTFGVDQAFSAYQKFNFEEIELLTDESDDPYGRVINDIMISRPVHIAVVTPEWDSGHNMVVDGYDSDDLYHINFGFGGGYDGWYALPDELPYDLTVLEGFIVNIFADCGAVKNEYRGKIKSESVNIYPNPFRSKCSIDYENEAHGQIFDINGRHIDSINLPGEFDGVDKNGNEIPRGTYLMIIESQQKTIIKKIVKID